MRRRAVPALLIILGLVLAVPLSATAATAPRVTADAAILMDWQTGMVLYEKSAYTLRHPASLTKMLTAIVAIETCNLQDVVTVDPVACNIRGSTVGLRAGQRFTLEDMLHMMLLESGNDAAIAVAIHVAGSVPAFSEMMNQRAVQLGARDTTFVNPHGLTAPGHITTAYDLAIIARHALSIPFLAATVATKEADIDRLDKDIIMRLHNTNRLLWDFPGTDGVKTGTTTAAGKSLAASATRDGHRLIAVVLHSDNRYRDAATLLGYGFETYALIRPFGKGDLVRTARVRSGMDVRVPLVAADDLAAIVPRSRAGSVVVTEAPAVLDAPCRPGDTIGEVRIELDGKTLAIAAVRPKHEVQRFSIWRWLHRRLVLPLGKWIEADEP